MDDPTVLSSSREKTTIGATRALGSVLVATDGSDGADAALVAARCLEAERGADVQVLAVSEPVPLPAPELVLTDWYRDFNKASEADLHDRVEQQLQRTFTAPVPWRVSVERGQPAAVIAQVARNVGARLIVTGLGKHGLAERLAADETVLRLLALSDVPILAVAPSFSELPRRAVFALDFSTASIDAARTALSIVAEPSLLYVAHVVPAGALSHRFSSESAYERALAELFERAEELLGLPTGRAERVILKGNPAEQVATFAEGAFADLVVAGSHGHGFIARMLLGSVARGLVRRAKCSMLIAPGRRAATPM